MILMLGLAVLNKVNLQNATLAMKAKYNIEYPEDPNGKSSLIKMSGEGAEKGEEKDNTDDNDDDYEEDNDNDDDDDEEENGDDNDDDEEEDDDDNDDDEEEENDKTYKINVKQDKEVAKKQISELQKNEILSALKYHNWKEAQKLGEQEKNKHRFYMKNDKVSLNSKKSEDKGKEKKEQDLLEIEQALKYNAFKKAHNLFKRPTHMQISLKKVDLKNKKNEEKGNNKKSQEFLEMYEALKFDNLKKVQKLREQEKVQQNLYMKKDKIDLNNKKGNDKRAKKKEQELLETMEALKFDAFFKERERKMQQSLNQNEFDFGAYNISNSYMNAYNKYNNIENSNYYNLGKSIKLYGQGINPKGYNYNLGESSNINIDDNNY